MTNHNPVFTSSAATGGFSETANTTNSSTAHTASGNLNFTDADHSDHHTTTASLHSATWSGGTGIPSSVVTDLGVAMTSSMVTDNNGSGTVKWSFSAADKDFDFLAKNETLILVYDIKVNDGHGGITTQTVTLTVTGTDDKPSFGVAATAGLTELAGLTGSSTLDTAHIALNFTDPDLDNTGHTASVTAVSASGVTSGIPAGAAGTAELMGFFHVDNIIKNAGSSTGTINTTFSGADSSFDYLAAGEKLKITYTVLLDDHAGGTSTQTVVVTVTGTNDKPVIAAGAAGSVTEQANQTLSLSFDTTHIAVHFTDADLSNVGHTATVTGVTATGSTGGLLPGSLGTAELLAFFNVDNVVKASGSSSGTINTTFSAPDIAFDYLAAGETLNIAYTLQVDDHAGGTSTQTVAVTVIGTNDKPVYLSGPESAHLIEDHNVSPSGNLTANGDLLFTDIDLSDTHTVSTTVTATRSGGGAIPLSNATLLAAMSTPLIDSTGHLIGDVDWSFALPNSSVNFLSGGETLTLTYNITVTDPSHVSDTETVTITILGTNHPVVITSGPESAALTETADTTGSPVIDTTTPVPTGTLNFSDPDTGDTHTVAVTVASETWSGGSGIPTTTQADLATALATTLHDSTGSGSGSVDWTFGIPDQDLDFLADGETLTINYNVKVSDNSTSATQTVSVTVTGTNDAPVITSGPESASLSELPDTSGSSTIDSTSPVPTGTLSFSDADLSDTHQVNVALASAVWSTSLPVPDATQVDLTTALATALHDSTGSGVGGVDWTFSIPDHDLDFLGAGETMTVTYDVTVVDATQSSTQQVTITVTGTQDPLVVNPVTAVAADTVSQDDGQYVAVGNVISDVGDTGGDQSTTLNVTDVNGQAANVGSFVAGTYGSVLIFDSGFYLYLANSNIDPLQVGQNPTDQFAFTVTDSLGRSVSTTLTFNVTGADDAPVITSANANGSMTEDAGPTVLVNGGFETGDLTGWTASAGVHAEFVALGGQFGNYAAHLTQSSGSISQAVATTPGEHYTVSFFVAGDPESTSNSLAVTWDGSTILALSNEQSGAFTQYSFDVVGDATLSTTSLSFSYGDDGTGLFLDQVSVNPASGPPTESADGDVHFSDVETGDAHTASFVPQGSDYVGTFSLDPVTETGGAGSVAWHFTVDNADIQFLSQGQTITQDYSVIVTDNFGASVAQDVTIAISGTNDAPTAVSENVITDVGPSGTVDIPAWALAANDTDPDMLDTVFANSILSSSGGTAVPFGDAFFIDDATPGGSFTYNVSDGIAVSSNAATATIVNNATSVTSLTGTSGDDILIGNNGSESLSGGGGNDVLIGNTGSHILTGGTGNDIFAFEQTTDGPNTITDFNNTTEHDRIAISASGFGGGLTPGMDVSAIFETYGDEQFVSPDSRFHFDTANQTLYYSADGTTASEIALAVLPSGVTPVPHDLLIV